MIICKKCYIWDKNKKKTKRKQKERKKKRKEKKEIDDMFITTAAYKYTDSTANKYRENYGEGQF